MQYSRGTIVAAARLLGTLGHTEIDDLLLEWGVPHLNAGRDIGSRAQRGVAIAKCAIDSPEAQTADGQSLSEAVVQRALAMSEGVSKDQHDEGGYRAAFIAAFAQAAGKPELAAPALPLPASPPKSLYSTQGPTGMQQTVKSAKSRVFLVHGRNEAAKDRVTLFLTRLGIETVILHEQANGGRTLLAKFLEEASSTTFAVVLMNPDDQGGLVGADALKPRSRQNVVFELGFFIGSLGADRVCALVEPTIERPSDFDAIAYVPFSGDSGWERLLARELRQAGIPINMEALL